MMAAPVPIQYHNIPLELQERRQWVMYRLEPREDGKTTKIPCQPNGENASSNNPRSWSHFSDCVAALSRFDGLGFVFCDDDPYTGIDLDYALDPAIQGVQRDIFNAFGTYTEISPSGRGCHIIARGILPVKGKRIPSIEAYSTGRFFTMTGNVVPGREAINDAQYYLDELHKFMCKHRPERIDGGHVYDDMPTTQEDAEVIAAALRSVNGERFKGLYEGAIAGVINRSTGQFHSADESGADQALMNIIAFHSRNKDQTRSIFMGSARGARDKCRTRPEYVQWTLERAFDNVPAPVDTAAIREALERQMAAFMPLTGVPALPDYTPSPDSPFTPPPGLVGEIAAYIYASAPRPVPEIALAGALALMAGICGNAYNIDGAGLNIYMMVVARTGTGKEAMASGISRLMHSLEAGNSAVKAFVGPSTFASAPGLMRQLGKTPSFVSMQGEFAYRLAAMSSERSNANDKILMGELLNLYGKSGQGNATSGAVYSKDDENIKGVKSPALSLLCDSEPVTLYSVLTSKMLASGLLPRFMLFEYKGKIPPYNDTHYSVGIPDSLKVNLLTLATRAMQYQDCGRVENVQYGTEARQLMDMFRDWSTDTANALPDDHPGQRMWTRTHVKAMKLAALVAVGVMPSRPTITVDMVKWAVDIVKFEANEIISKFVSGRTGEAFEGTEEDKQVKAVSTAIYAQLTQPYAKLKGYRVKESEYNEKLISYSYLMSRCHRSAAFAQARFPDTKKNLLRALDRLVAQEIIKVVDSTPPERGAAPKLYGVVDYEAVVKIAHNGE